MARSRRKGCTMNTRLMGGFGVLGGIALMIAMILIWLAISAAMDADKMRSDTYKMNQGLTKWVNDQTGASQVNENRIKSVQVLSVEFLIGAILMGLMGTGFLAVVGIIWLVNRNKRKQVVAAQLARPQTTG